MFGISTYYTIVYSFYFCTCSMFVYSPLFSIVPSLCWPLFCFLADPYLFLHCHMFSNNSIIFVFYATVSLHTLIHHVSFLLQLYYSDAQIDQPIIIQITENGRIFLYQAHIFAIPYDWCRGGSSYDGLAPLCDGCDVGNSITDKPWT